MATAYAATREQFGRPIGSFQSVKHHCANMLVDTELADRRRRGTPPAPTGAEADLAAAMAAGHALPAYQRVALQNVQVHGGIGYTWEHDAHLYIRRATVLQAFAGGRDALRDNVTELQRHGSAPGQLRRLCPRRPSSTGRRRVDFRAELEETAADGPPEAVGT